MSPTVDIAIVGAGPHGLAVLLHLLAADPSCRERVAVLDPSGAWMARWHDAFARLDIATLRSPAVHHPGPDPDGLLHFTRAEGHAPSGLPYEIPTRSTFAAYCSHLVSHHALEHAVVPAQVRLIRPEHGRLHLTLDDETMLARRVVLTGNPHRRVIPSWVYDLLPVAPHVVEHADDVDLRGLDLSGETVAVIGGGLSAAHLALGASARGARVRWISRRPVVARMFDVEPGWLGPKHLTRFEATHDPTARLELARRARDGGSVPPWMLDALEPVARAGRLERAVAEIVTARCENEGVVLTHADGHSTRADRVWLATGTTPAIDACHALRPVLDDVVSLDGFPVPDADLRIGPYPIHVAGRLAALALGPAAGNLWGARRAAVAITRACTGVDLDVLESMVPSSDGATRAIPTLS